MTSFQRRINYLDATSLVAGSMIGSGIFIVSADIARQLSSPGMLIIVWLLAGLLTTFAAIVYAELSSMMPNVGGQYVYLRVAYGPLAGFLYGWGLFMVIQTGTIAAVSMAFAKFSGVLVPWISNTNILFSVAGKKISSVHFVALASIWILLLYNLQGINHGKALQTVFTVLKVGILFFFILAGFFISGNRLAMISNHSYFWDVSRFALNNTAGLTGIGSSVAMAMVGALFALDAWYNVTFAADEVINPKQNLPRSLITGVIIVAILYLLTNVAYLRCLPLRGRPDSADILGRGIQYAVDDRVGTAALQGLLGIKAAAFMAAVIMISTFGCNNGIILSGARVFYSMAKDGLFFSQAGILNNRGIPGRALIIQCIWASLLCISGSYHQLLDYVVFVVLLFLVVTCFAVIRLRYIKPDAERPYRAWGYPIVPYVFIISALFIMLVLLLNRPGNTWPGIMIIIAGLPVYYLWVKKRKVKQNDKRPFDNSPAIL